MSARKQNRSSDSTLGLPEPQWPPVSNEEHNWPISHCCGSVRKGKGRCFADRSELQARGPYAIKLGCALNQLCWGT